MNYAEALGYLMDQESYLRRKQSGVEALPNPMRIMRLMAALGNPHARFQTVHIAGTKGKGSTSALCESMLHTLGYRTGLFTSPHLHTFRERIRVDQRLIGAHALADLMTRLRPTFEEMPDLTVFDRITALAYQHFAEQGVEWAVVEAGMGGRLDSTSVVAPAVCGITSISYDHMESLGHTLTLIAGEKAGIIKPDVPIFSAPQKPEALAAIQTAAQAKGTPLVIATPRERPPANLIGMHQRINAGLAQAMMDNLAQRGLIRATAAELEEGLVRTLWPGRFELLPPPGGVGYPAPQDDAPLIVDCAHNEDSMGRLVETLAQIYPQRPVTFIMGSSRAKQIEAMLAVLLAYAPRMILVSSHHPKAVPQDQIAQMAQDEAERQGITGHVQLRSVDSIDEALDAAAAITPAGGLRVGTGSVFVVAELREAWAARYPHAFPPADWVYEAPVEPEY